MPELLDILHELRPEFDFRKSDDFIRDGMLDSLDIATLVSALDQRFEIAIRGIDIIPENFRNLRAITSLLRAHGVKV